MNRYQFLTNEEQEILEDISFSTNPHLLGSQADPRMIYTMDYDILETFSKSKFEEGQISATLQRKIPVLESRSGYTIGDIKIGQDNKGDPLRWTPKEIKKGIKKDGSITLDEAVGQTLDGARLKLDLIVFMNDGAFHDWTNILQVKGTSKKIDEADELLKEAEEKKKEGHYYKMLKRILSVIKLEPETVEDGVQNGILGILNNPELGFLHQVNELLQSLMDLKDLGKRKNKDMKESINTIRNWLWQAYQGKHTKRFVQFLDELENSLDSKANLSQFQQTIQKNLDKPTKDLIDASGNIGKII